MISPDWKSLQKSRGSNLPHWNCKNAIYHVHFRLADSIPKAQRLKWVEEKNLLLAGAKTNGRKLNNEERNRLKFLMRAKIDKYLDAGYGKCYLRRPEIAKIVKESIQFSDGQRYHLHAWSIMPNHVHVIVEPIEGYPLPQILHTWKSYTANMINRKLNRRGQLWQHEPYDHIIRSEKEYWEQIEYVWNNPEKANLRDCPRWRIDSNSSM